MRRSLAVCALLAAGVGCNAILGIEDRPLRPDAGAGLDASRDGATPSDGGGGDAGDASDGAALSAYASAVLADKPILYLRFDEQSGLVAADATHHTDAQYPTVGVHLGDPGALVNEPASTAVSFNGTGKVHVPPSADFAGTASFSVEVWVKASGASVGNGFVVDHESWPSPGRSGWDLILETSGGGLERYADETTLVVGPVPAFAANAWHHVVATWDGTRSYTFVDGTLAGQSGDSTVAIGAVAEGWSIGGQNCSCSGNFFVGVLDELAVYDSVLTDQRVSAHYHASGR